MKSSKFLFFRVVSFLIACFVFSQSVAQEEKKTSPLKRADAISVKAALEDMIVRRYTQELSAIVSYEKFNIGARFELSVVEKDKDSNSNEDYTDLDLGYLDADTLFERYADVTTEAASPLEKYAVKNIAVNVGLSSVMGADVKKTVEDWLKQRVEEEFGPIGTSQVRYIQTEKTNPSFMERIKELQGLVGQMIIALAILLGVFLWRILIGNGSKKEEASANPINIQNNNEMGSGGSEASVAGGGVLAADQESSLISRIDQLSEQIKELAPKMMDELGGLIQEWCDQGEEGLYQIACFAEISGSVLGSLPIPKESKKQMANIFSTMHDMPLEKRYNMTNKTYWDLVASLNLGTDTLHRPFAFINNSPMGTVNQVLLGNDIDIQTVVSLYMPDSMRKNYFGKLDSDKKVELLNAAAKLSTISEENLQGIESKIAPYFEEKIDESEVSLSLTLYKLIDSMSIVDACQLLSKVDGPVMDSFKRNTPHIAFLKEWTVICMEILIKRASNEELMAYLRICPEMQKYVVELVSPRARQILEDDLSRPDSMKSAEKETHIQSLHNKLLYLINSGEITLDEAIVSDDKEKELKLAA